ncbi:MAG: hypothetical protein WBL19_00395, partial [Minisyncoccia bacterium]
RRATGRISIVGTTFHAPATHSSRITWERPTAPNQQLSKKSLTSELLVELPGILLWALEGWHRLHERGRFVEPASSREVIAEIEDLSSPVTAFVRERCVLGSGPDFRAHADALYRAWLAWCAADGRTNPSTKSIFLRDLSAAIPSIVRRRGSLNVPFYDGIAVGTGGS